MTRSRLSFSTSLALLAGAVVIMVTHTGPLLRPELIAPVISWEKHMTKFNEARAESAHGVIFYREH